MFECVDKLLIELDFFLVIVNSGSILNIRLYVSALMDVKNVLYH